MNRRNLLGVALVCLGLATVLAAFNYWSIVGWLRQDSFYQGKPTAYWEQELEQWQCVCVAYGSPDPFCIWIREPPFWERWWGHLSGTYPGRININTMPLFPPLLSGDPDAEPVLKELQLSSSKHVRDAARWGLR